MTFTTVRVYRFAAPPPPAGEDAGAPAGETPAHQTHKERRFFVTPYGMTENHEWLRQLVGWMIDYQEEERRRIAREVHGELGRCLTELAVELGLLRSALRGTPNDDATAHIAAMSELVSKAATAVRRVTSPLACSLSAKRCSSTVFSCLRRAVSVSSVASCARN